MRDREIASSSLMAAARNPARRSRHLNARDARGRAEYVARQRLRVAPQALCAAVEIALQGVCTSRSHRARIIGLHPAIERIGESSLSAGPCPCRRCPDRAALRRNPRRSRRSRPCARRPPMSRRAAAPEPARRAASKGRSGRRSCRRHLNVVKNTGARARSTTRGIKLADDCFRAADLLRIFNIKKIPSSEWLATDPATKVSTLRPDRLAGLWNQDMKRTAFLLASAMLAACTPGRQPARLSAGSRRRGQHRSRQRHQDHHPAAAGLSLRPRRRSPPDAWYYISSVEKQVAFFHPTVESRAILAVYFDKDGKVTDLKHFTLQDGHVVAFETRETPTRGRELTFLQQLFNATPGVPINRQRRPDKSRRRQGPAGGGGP